METSRPESLFVVHRKVVLLTLIGDTVTVFKRASFFKVSNRTHMIFLFQEWQLCLQTSLFKHTACIIYCVCKTWQLRSKILCFSLTRR